MTNPVAMVAEGLHKLALHRSQEALDNGALRPISTVRVDPDHPALSRTTHAQSKPRLLLKTLVAEDHI